MITLTSTFTGSEVADALLEDEEEFAYFLEYILARYPHAQEIESVMDEVSEYLGDDDKIRMSRMLRAMADVLHK